MNKIAFLMGLCTAAAGCSSHASALAFHLVIQDVGMAPDALVPADLERVGITLPGGSGGVPCDCAVSVLIDKAQNIRVIDGARGLAKLLEQEDSRDLLRYYARNTPELGPTYEDANPPLPGQVLVGNLDNVLEQPAEKLSKIFRHLRDRNQAIFGLGTSDDPGEFCVFADTDARYIALAKVLYAEGRMPPLESIKIVEGYADGRWVGTPLHRPVFTTEPESKSTYVFVSVTPTGFHIFGKNNYADDSEAALPAPAGPVTGNPGLVACEVFGDVGAPACPMTELTAKLRRFRGLNDAQTPLVVTLEDAMPVGVLTRTFTAVRSDGQGELFPMVILAKFVK